MANYYLSGNYNNTIDVILSLTESTNTTANTSTFNYTLYIYKKNNTSYSYSRGNHYGVTIGSYTTGDNTAGYSLGGVAIGGTYTLLTGTTSAIAHNSDGSGTVTISAWVRQDQLSNYNFSLSQTINLTTIPRASKPTASNATIGNTITINTNRASSSFTHTIQYKIGSLGYTNIATGVGASVNWTLPASLANYISNAASGTVTINCITYSGSTQIGTATTTLTATIPGSSFSIGSTGTVTMGNNNSVSVSNTCSAYLSVAITWSYGNGSGTVTTNWGTTNYNWPMSTFASRIPSATSGTCTVTQTTKRGSAQINQSSKTFTLALGSTNPSASVSISDANGYASRFGGYLAGKSKLSWSVSASASQGSSISSYSVSVGGIGTYSTSSGSVAIPSSITTADRSVSVTIKDARGKTATANAAYKTVAYKAPTVSATVTRADSSGNPQPSSGTYIRIRGSVTWSAITNNSVSAKYRIRQQNGSWSGYTNLTLSSNNFDTTVGTYTYEKGWEVQIVTADSVDTTGTTTSYTIGSAVFPIDVYPSQTSGIAFGKVSTAQGIVDSAWDFRTTGRYIMGDNTHAYTANIISGSSGNAEWVCLGELTSSGDSSNTIIDVYTGSGYNASPSQNSVFRIVIKDSWQSTASATSAFGISVMWFSNVDTSVVVKMITTSNTVGKVWLYLPWDYWNGSYEIHGRYSAWKHDGTHQTTEPSGTAQPVSYYYMYSNNNPQTSVASATNATNATNATTASYIDTPSNNGFTTDVHGNFKHSSATTTNNWNLQNNAGTAKFLFYWETGVFSATGDVQKNGTSIVPTGSNAQNSGYIRFPNARVQIAWDRRQINSQYVNNAWDKLYESAKLSFSNWAASFSGIPTTAYYITNTTSNFGCIIECYAEPTTTNPGAIYAVRPNASGSQNLVITALGVGPY